MALEQVVRPWQLLGTINDKKVRVTRVIKVVTERAILTWGSPGDAPETKQVGLNVTVKGADVKKAYTFVSRKTTDVRIENPNDSSQYVIAQRPDEVKFSRPKPFEDKKTGQPSNVPPGNQTADATTSTSSSSSAFSDGSVGTTITKTESGLSTTYVDGNTNATEVSTAGTVTTAPENKEETDTFILKWDDGGSAGTPVA